MAYIYETDCKRFLDPDGIIKRAKNNKELIDKLRDEWDHLYGIPPYSYEVYVLTDGTKPGLIQINHFLSFWFQPFYVGHGQTDHRVKESKLLGRQKDRSYTRKVSKMIEIIEKKNGCIREVRIGQFFTKEKASIVEKKIIREIDNKYPGILDNSLFNCCRIPLLEEDCNILCEKGIFSI